MNNMELTFQVVSWDQYFNAIVRERAYHTVEEYSVQTSYDTANDEDPMEIKDVTYDRNFQVVKELEDPSKDVRQMLMKQLNEAGVNSQVFDTDFEESLYEATMSAMDRFVDVDSCVLVDLGTFDQTIDDQHFKYNSYLLAPTTRDELVLKMLDFTRGALMVYTPKKFTMFSVINLVGSDNEVK